MSSWTCSICHGVNPLSACQCQTCDHGDRMKTIAANKRKQEDIRDGVLQISRTSPALAVADTVAGMLKLMKQQTEEKKEEKKEAKEYTMNDWWNDMDDPHRGR